MRKIKFTYEKSYSTILIYNMLFAIAIGFVLKYASTHEAQGWTAFIINYFPYIYGLSTVLLLIRKDSTNTIVDFFAFLITVGILSLVLNQSLILIQILLMYKILPYLVMTIVKIMNHRV